MSKFIDTAEGQEMLRWFENPENMLAFINRFNQRTDSCTCKLRLLDDGSGIYKTRNNCPLHSKQQEED